MARTKLGGGSIYFSNAEYFANIRTWLAKHQNIKLEVGVRERMNDGMRMLLGYKDENDEKERSFIRPFFQNWAEVFEHVHEVCPDVVGLEIYFPTLFLADAWDAQTFANFGKFSKLREFKVNGVALLTTVPQVWKHDLRKLKKLVLMSCHDLKHFDVLDAFVGLEALKVMYCSKVMEVPDSLSSLKALKELDLRECSGLNELPNVFHELANLEKINMMGCSQVKELPSTFGQLYKLTSLNLGYCAMLEQLPATFGNLNNSLQKLILEKCKELRELPSSLGEFSKLKMLDLEGCKMLKELPQFGASMEELEVLNINNCGVKLPPSLALCPKLIYFDARNNSSLEQKEQEIIYDGDEDALNYLQTKLVDAADVERAEAAKQSRKRHREVYSEEEFDESEED